MVVKYKSPEEAMNKAAKETILRKELEEEKFGSIINYFSEIKDIRVDRSKLHLLLDIIVIGICAVICGADTWEDMEGYGESKHEWLKGFLGLPNGIPSHDTFRRVFIQLDEEEFKTSFLKWIEAVSKITKGQVIAIDGKTLRHSFDKGTGKSAIHMVSAWASANSLVLGQVKVSEKSNEITAIPELLKILEISGCIVTIDAMGCQKTIAEAIIGKGGDYLLALKGNHGSLHEDVNLYFEDALKEGFKDIEYSFYENTDGGHGRIEVRKCWSVNDIGWITERKEWKGFKSICMVESERWINDSKTVERRYYISSLDMDAKQASNAIRSHWGIENSLHWILDIAFREDESRIRKGNGPQNFAILRHIALNLLKQERTSRVGIKAKRLKAGWDNEYLLKVLFG